MAIGQIFSELGTNLRRNVSMTVSLVVTMSVSLLLASLGLLVQAQADETERYFGDRLQVQVSMCTQNAATGPCVGGESTEEQRDAVVAALDETDVVADVESVSPEENLDRARERLEQSDYNDDVLDSLEPSDLPQTYLVTLTDPDEDDVVEQRIAGMDGVSSVTSLRELLGPLFRILDSIRWAALGTSVLLVLAAILQVSNTIRMTAYARRREIGIMRLVGASTWHIQMPFILESVVAALISAGAAFGGLALFMHFVVLDYLRPTFYELTVWVGWPEAIQVGLIVTGLALALALLPTLVMTRKYLKV